ncbi:AHH domain-containing protein [Tenacibaculum ovolyticum]|uniref:AHH domain-containing protein n=1 Tax=Tenacibaculum ovolyticum TaxID=104270 RepID=UPI0018D28A8E|nr:hypothetical protein [Tenacibaculum ovolyticum]
MKNKIANFLKSGTFLLGISLLLWNCENKEDPFNEIQSETILSTEAPTIETFSLNQLNKDLLFNDLKDNYRILQTKYNAKGSEGSSVRLIDTLGITIDANSVKKITGNNYVSYTMLMIEPTNTSNDFSNLVIQKREGEKRIFTVRYFQEKNKARNNLSIAKNSLTSFSGNFQMRSGITTTEMWGDPEDHGGGGGGGSGGCEEYITVCNTVNVWVPHGCGCGHMPGQSCDGCNGNYPYYSFETKEECKENCKWDNYSDNTGGNNTGNNSGGGGSPDNSNNDGNANVATTPVNPDGTSAVPLILISQLNITNQSQLNWINNQTLEIQTLLFKFLSNNNKNISDVEKVVKMYIEVSKNSNILGPYNVNFFNQINKYTTTDLSDPYIQSIWIAHFSAQCAIIKLQNPDWPDYKIYWEASKEIIHIGLDIGGMVPVVGEVCDVTNGVIYTIQGDGVNASLSFAAAIPIAGWAATGSKYAYKLTQYTINGTKIKLVLRILNDGSVYFGSSGSKLRKALGLTNAAKHAHHLIPWALRNHSVVEKAAKSKSAFHINEVLNGIPRLSNLHLTGHTAYNNKIKQILNGFDSNASVDKSYNFVSGLANHIRTVIQNNPNLNSGQIANLITFPN